MFQHIFLLSAKSLISNTARMF